MRNKFTIFAFEEWGWIFEAYIGNYFIGNEVLQRIFHKSNNITKVDSKVSNLIEKKSSFSQIMFITQHSLSSTQDTWSYVSFDLWFPQYNNFSLNSRNSY